MKQITIFLFLLLFSCKQEKSTPEKTEIPTIKTQNIFYYPYMEENPFFWNFLFSIQRKYKSITGDTIILSPRGENVLLFWNQRPASINMYTEIEVKEGTVSILVFLQPKNFFVEQRINGTEIVDTTISDEEREDLAYQLVFAVLRKNKCPIIGID